MRLENLWYSIDRLSMPEAKICRIDYSVDLIFDDQILLHDVDIDMWCELWGHNVFLDSQLAAIHFDQHSENVTKSLHIKRYFSLNCDILHDDIIGKSEIYLKVIVCSENFLIESDSELIKAYF